MTQLHCLSNQERAKESPRSVVGPDSRDYRTGINPASTTKTLGVAVLKWGWEGLMGLGEQLLKRGPLQAEGG